MIIIVLVGDGRFVHIIELQHHHSLYLTYIEIFLFK